MESLQVFIFFGTEMVKRGANYHLLPTLIQKYRFNAFKKKKKNLFGRTSLQTYSGANLRA